MTTDDPGCSTKKIAIVTSLGFSLHTFRGPLIKKLVASHAKVYALAPDFDEDLKQRVSEVGADPVHFSLARTGMNPVRDMVDMFRLAFLLRRLKPDVILTYFMKPVVYGTLAAWVAGVPKRLAMIEGLGYVFTETEKRPKIMRKTLQKSVLILLLAALKKADKVIFLNTDDIAELVDNAKVLSRRKVYYLGGIGVDLEEWQHSPPILKPVTFTLIGRLLREKGIVEYAEAARIVKKQHPNVRFLLLGGEDPNPGSLPREKVDQWVREGLIEWLGHVPVQSWLEKTSVFVLPSYREGVPRSTQEALAIGRPIITTDVPGCRETVIDNSNGFLVRPADAEALAHAMLRFIEKPELISIMGRSSRVLAESFFDIHKKDIQLMKWMDVPTPENNQ